MKQDRRTKPFRTAPEERKLLAGEIAEESIVMTALARFIEQIAAVCAERVAERVEAMRAKCEAIAQEHDGDEHGDEIPKDGGKVRVLSIPGDYVLCARRIRNTIAALKRADNERS